MKVLLGGPLVLGEGRRFMNDSTLHNQIQLLTQLNKPRPHTQSQRPLRKVGYNFAQGVTMVDLLIYPRGQMLIT